MTPERKQDSVRDCLELLLHLRAAPEPVTFEQLRSVVAAYDQENRDSGRRKFERDKATLRGLGVSIETDDEEDTYRLKRDETFLFDVDLEEGDELLLRGLCSGFASDPGFPRRQALTQAMVKLLQLQGEGPDEEPEPLLVRHPVRDAAELESMGETLADAVQQRHRVDLVYGNAHSGPPERSVDPYALFLSRGHWYLCGRCHAAESIRVFRLSRIDSFEVPHAKRKTPDFETPADFDLAPYARLDPVHFNIHEPMVVTLRVESDVDHIARARLLGAREEPTGTFHVTTTNLEAVLQHALYFGSHAEILGPPEAREALVEVLDRLIEVHGG